jgi:hypothetical protein
MFIIIFLIFILNIKNVYIIKYKTNIKILLRVKIFYKKEKKISWDKEDFKEYQKINREGFND